MKQQILDAQKREYISAYSQRLARLGELIDAIEAGDDTHKAEALELTTFFVKHGDNVAFLANEISEKLDPTTPEKITSMIAKPQPQQPRYKAKTYAEIIRDGSRGRD